MKVSSELKPKSRRIKDYKYCFYGHEIKKPEIEDEEVYKTLRSFLLDYYMEIYPLVEAGKWLWPELVKRMERSAFCVFNTESANRNVHIELGYALAKNLDVIVLVLVPEDKKGDKSRNNTPENKELSKDYTKYLPSDLAGMIQIRYSDTQELKKKLKKKFEKEIPKRYLSVDERLGMALKSVTELDRDYFGILLNAKQPIEFSQLVGKARAQHPSSSNTDLADFMRKYDEAIVFEKETLESCEGKFCALSAFYEIPKLDQVPLSIDEEYKEWIIRKLGGI